MECCQGIRLNHNIQRHAAKIPAMTTTTPPIPTVIADNAAQSDDFRVPARRSNTVYDQFECELNTIDVEDLFARYAECGFLYPEKLERLKRFLPEIIENWRRSLKAGDKLHRVVTYENESQDAWASISSWRTTQRGWSTQHLVSQGNPTVSRMRI